MTTTTAPTVETVRLGARDVTLERPSGLKATRALAILRSIARSSDAMQTHLAEFTARYEREHVVEFDRVQAKIQFPARPLIRDGELVPNPDHPGEVLVVPSPVERLTEEDWAAAGGIYRAPRSPKQEEIVVALFDVALDAAEEHLYRFLTLFTIPNDELKRQRKDGNLDAFLEAATIDLLDDAFGDEFMDLAAAVGDVLDQHFARKARAIGGRLGKFGQMLGMGPKTPSPSSANASSPASTSETAPSSPRPSSSTASPASTPDGPPTSSSTPPTTSSSSSAPSSSETAETPPPATSSTD